MVTFEKCTILGPQTKVQADNDAGDKEELAMNHRMVTAVNSNLNHDADVKNLAGGAIPFWTRSLINAMKRLTKVIILSII